MSSPRESACGLRLENRQNSEHKTAAGIVLIGRCRPQFPAPAEERLSAGPDAAAHFR